jgi:hypothetical protein
LLQLNQGETKMGFYNPFHEIFETSAFMHARTLRTSFWEKILDTYFVFSGSFFNKKIKTMLDFLIILP